MKILKALGEGTPLVNDGERWSPSDVASAIVGSRHRHGVTNPHPHGSNEASAWEQGVDAMARFVIGALKHVPEQNLAVAYNAIHGQDPGGAPYSDEKDPGFNTNIPDDEEHQ